MTISPAISVIIPVFNAEKYIAECLESILAQTFQDFEVIFVDDCSTDNSVAIAENYLEKFGGQLKILSLEENTGSGAVPRNEGLKFSRGEYIFFMDNDDLITPTAFEEFYTLAKNFDADVVHCGNNYVTNADLSEIHIQGDFSDKPTFESENLAKRIDKIVKEKISVTLWRNFVRRDLLIEYEIFFPPCKISDDNIWFYGIMFFAKNFLLVPNINYVYRLSESSILRKERTPQQIINFWLDPLIYGLKYLDNLMNKAKFFRQNPQYRCVLLKYFVYTRIYCLFKASCELNLPEIYDAIRRKFEKDLGEWDVLISFLLADFIGQQKFLVKMEERIAELEKNK